MFASRIQLKIEDINRQTSGLYFAPHFLFTISAWRGWNEKTVNPATRANLKSSKKGYEFNCSSAPYAAETLVSQ
jgi:hypothetical protein